MRFSLGVVVGLLLMVNAVHGGVLDFLGLGKKRTNETAAVSAGLGAALSTEQLVGGLKEALDKGVQQAVSRLGRENGFLTNVNVCIPMPEKLQTAEKALRTLKQDQLADDFIQTMNRAAEQAVPEAAAVFGQAIQQMTFADARGILSGTTNAATQYFRRTTETNLYATFRPIVAKATDEAGVTSAYKRVVEKAGGGSALGSFGRSVLGLDSVDLDGYVTQKALDGLFLMVAEEEGRIRANPAARTTTLLQKVFGAATK